MRLQPTHQGLCVEQQLVLCAQKVTIFMTAHIIAICAQSWTGELAIEPDTGSLSGSVAALINARHLSNLVHCMTANGHYIKK